MVSAEEFVRVYLSATTIEEVVKATGLPASQIRNKASHLRSMGVKLPSKFVKSKRTDVGALNTLVTEMTSK